MSMENKKQSWFKPAIKSIGRTCLCCGETSEILELDTKLYFGFGGWVITKNGQEFFSSNPDLEWNENKDLEYIETLIGENTEDEFIARFDAPLRDATYQRHSKNNWVLIQKGEGFA